jgi:hypothetical protein
MPLGYNGPKSPQTRLKDDTELIIKEWTIIGYESVKVLHTGTDYHGIGPARRTANQDLVLSPAKAYLDQGMDEYVNPILFQITGLFIGFSPFGSLASSVKAAG